MLNSHRDGGMVFSLGTLAGAIAVGGGRQGKSVPCDVTGRCARIERAPMYPAAVLYDACCEPWYICRSTHVDQTYQYSKFEHTMSVEDQSI